MPHDATRDAGTAVPYTHPMDSGLTGLPGVIRKGLTRESGGSSVRDLRSAMWHLEADPPKRSMERSGHDH